MKFDDDDDDNDDVDDDDGEKYSVSIISCKWSVCTKHKITLWTNNGTGKWNNSS